jgi:hypothetical protein
MDEEVSLLAIPLSDTLDWFFSLTEMACPLWTLLRSCRRAFFPYHLCVFTLLHIANFS